ncbi:MAG: type I-B CRISPR-associated protein Cas7/Csh2, partial [Methanobacteriaceae archaeon]
EAIWNGTKNLITRSKMGQMPRFLMKVEYNEENYFIGDLDKKIKIVHDLGNDKKLRDIKEFKLDISDLVNQLIVNSDKINSILLKVDPFANFIFDDSEVKGDLLVNEISNIDGLKVKELEL